LIPAEDIDDTPKEENWTLKTEENLRAAFAGESQANRRYLAFSKKAVDEGYPQIAKLFRAAADSETVHALSHLRVLKGVKTTHENLQEALMGETYEFEKMYSEFIEAANKEGRKDAIVTFRNASEAEKGHAKYYQKAIEVLKTAKDLASADYFVCQVCGHTAESEAPESCPVCGSPKKMFKKIE